MCFAIPLLPFFHSSLVNAVILLPCSFARKYKHLCSNRCPGNLLPCSFPLFARDLATLGVRARADEPTDRDSNLCLFSKIRKHPETALSATPGHPGRRGRTLTPYGTMRERMGQFVARETQQRPQSDRLGEGTHGMRGDGVRRHGKPGHTSALPWDSVNVRLSARARGAMPAARGATGARGAMPDARGATGAKGSEGTHRAQVRPACERGSLSAPRLPMYGDQVAHKKGPPGMGAGRASRQGERWKGGGPRALLLR